MSRSAERHRGLARSLALVCGVAGCLVSERARGQEVSFLLLRPEFGVQAGRETYELSLSEQAAGTTVSVASKLSYPVETVIAGGTVGLAVGDVSFGATALTNVVDPWGTLLDQDFISVPGQSIEFSHTDSRTTLRSFAVEGVVRVRVAELSHVKGRAPFHLLAGFRYESSVYDAYGASGWQVDPNTLDRVDFTIEDIHGIHYDVRYRIPFIGARVDWRASRKVVVGAEGRLLASFSTHDDDHLLRHKTAHAAPHGGGLAIAVEPAIDLGGGEGAHAFLGLSGQLQYLAAFDGRLHQHYYGDDPAVMGDQSNTPIPDSDFSFTSIRARLLAFLAVKF